MNGGLQKEPLKEEEPEEEEDYTCKAGMFKILLSDITRPHKSDWGNQSHRRQLLCTVYSLHVRSHILTVDLQVMAHQSLWSKSRLRNRRMESRGSL